MFCDLVGSTELAERLDPEDLHELLSDYQNAVARAIRRFGGHVAKYLGDGVVVFFGYPVAHEDDPCRAILAGMEILGEMARLNERRGTGLAVRVGIHTGLVVASEVGGQGDVTGETPNIAARLQEVAGLNGVAVSESTHRLAASEFEFEFESLGPKTLKGLSRSMEVFRPFRQVEEANLGQDPMVGRGSELDLLVERGRRAAAGSGQTVFLGGEAGIGKSRLLSAFRDRVLGIGLGQEGRAIKKIAVLGGGGGSMAAAFALTERPGWQDEYEITVYQMGWRLGGKGASGRGPNGRIEEHGLHIWLGFYDNAFGVMQRAYKEMDRPEGAPLRDWQDAFKKHSFVVLEEKTKDGWRHWPIEFPEDGHLPGPGTPLPTLWDYIGLTVRAMSSSFKDALSRHPVLHDKLTFSEQMHRIAEDCELAIDFAEMSIGEAALHAAACLHEHLPHNPEEHTQGTYERLIALLDEYLDWLEGRIEAHTEDNAELRRLVLLADLAFANIRAVLREGVMESPDGLDVLDKYEYIEFLRKHGSRRASIDAAPIKGLYDLVFGYKGAIFWKMQAGMGDTVFTPLHKVLEKRGVKFAFFHRVENLGLAEGEDVVETITVTRQATVKAGEFAYDPYVEVQRLACWTSVPNYDQLEEGDALREENVNLESFWSGWPDAETRTLRRGVDFDDVVLGISVGAFPYVAPELAARNARWKAMVERVGTVGTMSMQMWLTPTLTELGWKMPSPVMDGYADDMNTWADMTHLVPREAFPPTHPVGNVAYYCGPMVGGIPDPEDRDAPRRAYDAVCAHGKEWLGKNSGFLWPDAAPAHDPDGLDWAHLVDTSGNVGVARFDTQYFRANIDPSERYVLTLKGSTAYRLRAGESGFSNLFLTGDWTQNDFNVGCVEATVMSGMLCSNAMTGYPPLEEIVGNDHA